MLSMERFCESRQLRNKLLNIHYVGGNGGEFFATMMQNHSEFNFHDGCYNDPKAIKYEFKRDEFDNLSQYYLGWGIDNDCLTNYSPKEFFEMWKTSPDKWTIRVDHGYGYNTQTEEWRKGLYTDWNVSKTIILNCTEIKGAEYCRGLCYHKVFGKEYYEVITKKGDTPIIKSCAISIIRDRLFKTQKFVDFNNFRLERDTDLNVGSAIRLEQITYNEYVDTFIDQENETDITLGSSPIRVFKTLDNSFGVVPMPDKSYNITYEYFNFPVDLNLSTDAPTIPERFKFVITDGAMYHAYMFRDNMELGQITFKKFEEGMKNMRKLLVNENVYIRAT